MSSDRQREWRFYVRDMEAFAERVQEYSSDFSQESFIESGLNYDATLRNLELIGEAASHIPDEVRAQYGDVPWRLMVATRNRLIHGYLGIDSDTVWSIIQDDIPALKINLEGIQEKLKR